MGIIGVVAALTMPTLIANHQKQALITALKKSFNVLSNMVNNMKIADGVEDYSHTTCATTDDFDTCKEKVLAQFGGNAVKVEEVVEEVKVDGYYMLSGGCGQCVWVDATGKLTFMYGGYTADSPDECVELFGTPSTGESSKTGLKVTTADGLMYLFDGGFSSVTVDVNGEGKAPNLDGKDIFVFQIFTNGKVVPTGAASQIIQTGKME